MPRAAKTVFERAQKLGLHLPGVEVGTSWGTPSLKVDGKMFACIPSHKSAEPDSLAVRLSFLDRDLRLRSEPDAYYLKPHYEGYPCVLVRVKRLTDEALKEVLETGYEFVKSTSRRR